MTQINYYLRPTTKNQDSKKSLTKLIEYFVSFVGDIEVKKENETSAIVNYIGTPTVAFIKAEKTGQLTIAISEEDNVTINLINNQSQSLGFRIYNPQINAFLPNEINLYDLTTIKVDPNIKNVIKGYQLTPLFQFRDSYVFFAKANDSSIHLVNRHLLEYLVSNPIDKLFKSEFSVKVADDISQFIALFDRGLISLTNPNSKIINLSGFDLQNLPKNTKLNIINFTFDEENQSFVQQDTTDIIPKKYLAMKIGQDYTYTMQDKKLIKHINVSVFN